MEEIFEPNDQFDFNKLVLTKPVSMPGGNFFIRFLVNGSHLYVQPPKCKTKQGIIKGGKRLYSDLMFTHEDYQFIRWMENLENHCQQYILKHKSEWFEGDLELHDIENYFTSPLKVYKSGTCYTVRTNISTVLGKPSLKIYDEHENELAMEAINDKMNIMTILEVQGIKCSARSFQIEIELKQLLSLAPVNIFDKCLLIKKPTGGAVSNKEVEKQDSLLAINTDELVNGEIGEPLVNEEAIATEAIATEQAIATEAIATEQVTEQVTGTVTLEEESIVALEEVLPADDLITNEEDKEEVPLIKDPNAIEEVEFNLDELPEDTSIQIKKRNDVYYEMYREARRKAKIARDLALSSYLEVKRIKNTYMLDDIKDSDDESDSESGEPTVLSES